jgi:hypothetical protein
MMGSGRWIGHSALSNSSVLKFAPMVGGDLDDPEFHETRYTGVVW